jgi:hypothetical protein
MERLKITIRDSKKNEWVEFFDVPVRKKLPEITSFVIADGRTLTFARAGKSVETAKLGHGNGDGVANPGESIVILVNDKDTLRRADLIGKDKWINPYGVNIRKSDNWASFDYVGGSAKYHVPLISSDCPQNHPVEFFAEYWLPDYPLHIIKRGVVRFQVRGKDATPPVIANVLVTGDNVLQVYAYDGSIIRSAKATLVSEKDPERSVVAILTDDGKNGDRVEGDLVFSQTIPSQVFGIFTAKVEMEDSFGNKSILVPDEQFVLH